ncbi:MAG: adenosine deaminase [Ferruginibacter sp.]
MNLQQLPKVELHLHLDCGLSFEVVSKIDPSVTYETWLTEFVAPAKCLDLADFLSSVKKSVALMQTKEHLQWVIEDLFRQLQANNIIYAEIRFAPLQHLRKGLTPYEVVAAVDLATAKATRETGVEARLILCTLRHLSEDQSMQTVKLVEAFKGTCVAGFDIAADEAGFPITNHIRAFEYAKEKGIGCTAHAGEAKGAESVWETLQYFRPTRIGHGVRSIEDPKLIEHLVEHRIHLEICPSCNVQTGMYDAYAQHPINELYRSGISLNVNTDAPTVADISLTKEYGKLQDAFGWTAFDFYTCNVYALEAAFVGAGVKEVLLHKLKKGYGML